MNLLILGQAMQIYKLGMEVEIARGKLNDCVKKYGVASDFALKQAQKLDMLNNKFLKLEIQHIAATEKYLQRRGKN